MRPITFCGCCLEVYCVCSTSYTFLKNDKCVKFLKNIKNRQLRIRIYAKMNSFQKVTVAHFPDIISPKAASFYANRKHECL